MPVGYELRQIMKKAVIILLVVDLLMGLLLLFDGDGQRQNAEVMPVVAAPETAVKKIALTFDDGPHPYYTEQLLDGLKERGVVASFFVTGEHVTLHPDVIKRMHEEGHLIGNHTYSHMQLTASQKEEFKEELVATSEVIEELIGEEVIYVRPPYGIWDKSLEQELNMIPVLWSIDSLDWCSNDACSVVRRTVEAAGEDEIILMHDYYENSVTAALAVVDELLKEDYTFVTVEEILLE